MTIEAFIALVSQGGPVAVIGLLAVLYWREQASHEVTRQAFVALQNATKTDAVGLTREVVGAMRDTTAALNRIGEGAEHNRAVLATIAESITEVAVTVRRSGRAR